jgi:hypothetical protein
MSILIVPRRPARASVAESGTTDTTRDEAPRSMMPRWLSTKEPAFPARLPRTRSIATYAPEPSAAVVA